MSSFTQKTGRAGVLSYGLFKIYRSRFRPIDWKSDASVDYCTWLRICKKFNQRKMESVIKGQIFNMPFRLGSIGIVQYKKRIRFDENGKLLRRGLIPDWAKTYKMWYEMYPQCKKRSDFKAIPGKTIVYRTNEHTDGRIFRFHWKKKYSIVKNISAYKLVVALQYKKALGRRIQENNNVQYCTKF